MTFKIKDLNFTIAVHGGAGTILRSDMTPEKEADYRLALEESLDAGYDLLRQGKTAIDAVKAAVISLENNILFNAGKGSVYSNDRSQEMDASIMNGADLMAGAVSAVRNIRNPIDLAYTVMTQSAHVYLTGKGAMDFAKEKNIASEPDEYFYSEQRMEQWKQLQKSGSTALDHGLPPGDKKFGTVGAVAFDQQGNIAAATSTGGMTNKLWGRVGDSPIIGAGTYANNKTCAISCTGHGELFIRAVAAYDVSCLMEYAGLSLEKAMQRVVNDKLVKIGGEGGMIGVDREGNAVMLFNSPGMYRGMKDSTGRTKIAIYEDEG